MKNETNINGIVFLRSYFESIEELEGSDKMEMYDAIFGLVFNNIAPVFSKKYLNGYWKLIEPTLASSINRYQASQENGKKGGRPAGKKAEANKTPEPTIITETIVDTIQEETIQPDDYSKVKLNDLDSSMIRELSDFKSKYQFFIPTVLIPYMNLIEGKLGLENRLRKNLTQLAFNIDLLHILQEQHNKNY